MILYVERIMATFAYGYLSYAHVTLRAKSMLVAILLKIMQILSLQVSSVASLNRQGAWSKSKLDFQSYFILWSFATLLPWLALIRTQAAKEVLPRPSVLGKLKEGEEMQT
jgi:hypothetical protein